MPTPSFVILLTHLIPKLLLYLVAIPIWCPNPILRGQAQETAQSLLKALDGAASAIRLKALRDPILIFYCSLIVSSINRPLLGRPVSGSADDCRRKLPLRLPLKRFASLSPPASAGLPTVNQSEVS